MTISKTVFDRSNNKKILLLDFAEKLPAGKNKSLLNIEDGTGFRFWNERPGQIAHFKTTKEFFQ